ncbi:hypothetical protein GCM10023261_00760 [Bartonella jaculi]|uniref:Uncharacterized protein n=1 Tax=Bartonella jaculi TaxID=686226 RepID=A0ABP9N370_9HYPH
MIILLKNVSWIDSVLQLKIETKGAVYALFIDKKFIKFVFYEMEYSCVKFVSLTLL